MAYVRGDETAEEILALAYGMEEGLGAFYAALGLRTQDPALKSVFDKKH